jgi:hypothetical protein
MSEQRTDETSAGATMTDDGSPPAIDAVEAVVRRAPTSAFLARRFGITTERLPFRMGRESAETVAHQLQALDGSWQVLHGVPTGSDHRVVDHLLIGPSGVYTLNVEDHRGSAVVIRDATWLDADGSSRPSLHAARTEATRAARNLSRACGFVVPVQPVLVVLADTIIITGPLDGVAIVSPGYAVPWLTDQPHRFEPNDVCAVFGQARRASIWR